MNTILSKLWKSLIFLKILIFGQFWAIWGFAGYCFCLKYALSYVFVLVSTFKYKFLTKSTCLEIKFWIFVKPQVSWALSSQVCLRLAQNGENRWFLQHYWIISRFWAFWGLAGILLTLSNMKFLNFFLGFHI